MNRYDATGRLRPQFAPTTRVVPRPEGYMENPYIGRDDREYHSHEALQEANRRYNNQMSALIAVSFLAGAVAGAAGISLRARYLENRILEEARELEQAKTCYQTLQPLRSKFDKICLTKKTLDTMYDGSLNSTVEDRKAVIERLDCPSSIAKKTWKCSYNVSEKRFEVIEK